MEKKEELAHGYYQMNEDGEWVRSDPMDERTLPQKALEGYVKPEDVPAGGAYADRRGKYWRGK